MSPVSVYSPTPSAASYRTPFSSTSSLRLESAQSRNQILQEIASRRGIVRELDAGLIAWSLPKQSFKGAPEPRGKYRNVTINLISLCSPGAFIFTKCNKLFPTRFTATVDTRAVRDIKRPYSWKLYGVSYQEGLKAHYVRIQFADEDTDSQFQLLVTLLDSISAKRHLSLENVRPFGVGRDLGVPAPHRSNRLYIITHCAKATPSLRRVSVDFELFLDSAWKRIEVPVDRLGFATYKSADRSNIIVAGGPEDIHFLDDPFVRFARMTLRFGDRPERTYIDIEHSEKVHDQACFIMRTKKGSAVYIPNSRVRTSDGSSTVDEPVNTMTRLVFRDREGGLGFVRRSGGAADVEAEKVASLIRKTTRLAVRNPLGVKSSVADGSIFMMKMRGVVSEKGYRVRNADDGHSFEADIRDKFRECVVYAVPSLRAGTSGIVLISHSKDGEAVLRQHVDNPISLIVSISPRGFGVPYNSTLVRTRDGSKSIGVGMIRYAFSHGESDSRKLVDKLTQLLTKIEPRRLPELGDALAKKARQELQHSNTWRTLPPLPTEISPAAVASSPPPPPPPPPPSPHIKNPSVSKNLPTPSQLAQQPPLSPIYDDDMDELIAPLSHIYTQSHYRSSSDASAVSNYSELSNTSTVDSRGSAPTNREPSDWDLYEPCIKAPVFASSSHLASPTKPSSSPDMCRAKQEYKAVLRREVGMAEGEFMVVEYRNNSWSFVRRIDGAEEGWVPSAFLEFV